jgi:adenylate kinase family enzyme
MNKYKSITESLISVGKNNRRYYANRGSRPLIALIGSPGSGKSTQARMIVEAISKRHEVKYINLGEILRKSSDTEIIKIMNEGKLIPDEIVYEYLTEELKNTSKSFIILDGFFRNEEETDWLIENQKTLDVDVWKVIDIKLNKDEAMKRLSIRGRADDQPEDIAVRLKVFEAEREGVVRSLKKHKMKLDVVDGFGAVDQVFGRIGSILDWCCPGYECIDLSLKVKEKVNK